MLYEDDFEFVQHLSQLLFFVLLKFILIGSTDHILDFSFYFTVLIRVCIVNKRRIGERIFLLSGSVVIKMRPFNFFRVLCS